MSLARLDSDLAPLPLRGLRPKANLPRLTRSPAAAYHQTDAASKSAAATADSVARAKVVQLPAVPSFQARLVAAIPDLKRLAGRLTGSRPDALDLVQETCRRALDSQVQFTTGGDLKPWLFSILRNIHLDECRRVRRLVAVGSGDELTPAPVREPKPLWTWVSEEELSRALDSLSPIYRCVYTLHTIKKERYVEIARRLGISANTVGTRLNRARARLRSFLMRELAGRWGQATEAE
jgi:RNA polymerase sigma-70 factor (ECF subfamily)